MQTKTIEQTVLFKASPKKVYDMIMVSEKHQSLSGLKASIGRKVGQSFHAWNGHIEGVNLALQPGRRIVQAWRATGWWPDHFSIAIFELERMKGGTRLHFTQIGVPPHRYSGHYRGWIETYWTPMKELLENGSLSEKTAARVEADKARIQKKSFRRTISNAA